MRCTLRTLLRISAVFFLSLGVAGAQTATPAQQSSTPKAAGAKKPKPAAKGKVFPYEIVSRKLPNGLNVVIVPTPEFKDTVTFASLVMAGSRNETEKGKTGLAHLFEHIMFRHEYGGKPGGYDAEIARMGADNNAFTSYDLTFYHPTTFTSNLIGPIQRPDGPLTPLIDLEAARFQGLKVAQKTFQVEAGAVLGEYRRIFSFPDEKMVEVSSPIAYPNHPYGHTVIGYREDVENMPNAWDAAWDFYRNYYTPTTVAIIVVGDVDPKALMPEIEKRYSGWKPAKPPAIPPPQEPAKEKSVHVDWEAEVSPKLMVAYHTPAFQPGSKESAVGQILPELLTSRSAPLFQKLRYQKQTVTDFGLYDTPESTDPHWLAMSAELSLDRFKKDGKPYVAEVKADIVTGTEALKNFSQDKNAARTLAVVKSKVRNDFLGGLNSTLSIATQLGLYFRFNQNPQVFEQLMDAIDALTPADVDAYARKYFTANRRITTTLWYAPPKAGLAPANKPEVK